MEVIHASSANITIPRRPSNAPLEGIEAALFHSVPAFRPSIIIEKVNVYNQEKHKLDETRRFQIMTRLFYQVLWFWDWS